MTTEKTANGEEWVLPGVEAVLKTEVDPPEGCIQAEGSWRVALPGHLADDIITGVTLALNTAGVLSFYTSDGKLISAYPPGGWTRVIRILEGNLEGNL